MSIKKVYSEKQQINEAVSELREGFGDAELKIVVFFASSNFNQDDVAAEMEKQFSGAKVFGCTTAGELISGKVLKNSIVAMSLGGDEVEDCEIGLIENITKEHDENVKKTFGKFEEHFGVSCSEMDIDKYVAIILLDGMTGAEEAVMDKIGDMTNIVVIGGSAGDDLRFDKTYVFDGNGAHNNAAVVALMKMKKEFDVIKTQSFDILDKKFIATKVDEPNRTVIEFDGRPAAEVYAEAIGVDVKEAPDHFMENPVGLIIDGEPFVRSPQKLEGEGGLRFYCKVKEGMELSLLKSTDMVRDTHDAVQAKLKELGEISGIINFHCILRTLDLEKKNKTAEYGEVFKDIPTIGFSTYGEEYLGHVNQTSTMLVFK